MAIAAVILGAGADEMIQPLYAAGSALFLAAAIAVVNEQTLKERTDIVVNEVVNNPVAKISRENLSLNGFENYETNTGADFVFPVLDFFVKFKQFSLVVDFKCQSVNGVSFVLAGVKIGLK